MIKAINEIEKNFGITDTVITCAGLIFIFNY